MDLGLFDAHQLIHKGILALARAERHGIRIDMEYARNQEIELTEKIDSMILDLKRTKFYRHWEKSRGKSSLNIDSNYQLSTFLYKIKKLTPLKTTPSGQGSTDEEALEALGIPELNDILRVRKLKKIRDTYLHSFLMEAVGGVLHPNFNLHTVSTYRSSSNNPNFQNIPIRDSAASNILRNCLYPSKGNQLLEVDYGALEVRIATCYHKDPTMIQYIKDPTSDMHGDMARQIFKLDSFEKKNKSMKTLRNGAKNGFVFPQFYGDYYGNNVIGLSKWAELPLKGRYGMNNGLDLGGITVGEHLKQNGILSLKGFANHLKKIEEHFWNKRFPVYKRWKEEWWNDYQQKGYIEMLTGFRCSGIMGRNDCINYPVQGAAFHCLLWSFIALDDYVIKHNMRTKLIGQIHDSILFDVYPPELGDIKELARKITCIELPKAWPWIIVPLDISADLCGIDESWFTKEEIVI